MRLSLLTLFCLNLALVLFPVIAPEFDPSGANALFAAEISLYGRILSSVLTPLLVAATLAVALLDNRRTRIPADLLAASLVICALMCMSTLMAETARMETLFMGVFFVLFTLYLTLARTSEDSARQVLTVFRAYFIVWLLAPLAAMLLDPSLFTMFVIVSPIDVSYHGLADSRVGFGLWISVFIILLRRPTSRLDWILMAVAVATLALSQSRAAIAGLLLSYVYALFKSAATRPGRGRVLALRLMLLLALFAVPIWLWSVFGRDDALTLLSEDRSVVLSHFFDFIATHWLFGNGGMYLVDLPEIGQVDVPAHNILVQTVANYGVLALLAFLAYFVCIFRTVRSVRARMLLIFLFAYSMNQPVQGTGNFFNPITLLVFLIAFAVDTVEARARPVAKPAPTASARFIARMRAPRPHSA